MKYQARILIYLLLVNLILFPLTSKQAGAQAAGSADCPLPPADVLGEDIAGFPRYPNSVRMRFVRETERSILSLNQQAKGMEVAYRSNDGMNDILNFYRRQVKEQGWELFSSNYFGEHSIHMVLRRGETRILLMLRPHTRFIPARSSATSREESQPPSTTTPTNCYVIQVFSWNEADAKPMERRTRPFNDQRRLPGRSGR
jgi:hypothetical protein